MTALRKERQFSNGLDSPSMENRESIFPSIWFRCGTFSLKLLSKYRFQFVWVWYAVMFCAGLCVVSMMCSVWFLTSIRFTSSKSAAGNKDKCDEELMEQDLMDSGSCSLKARGITLTFKNINYVVSASTTKDKLHLLKGITGYFSAGKMTALMGSR